MTENREKDRLDTLAWTTRRAKRVEGKIFVVSFKLKNFKVLTSLNVIFLLLLCPIDFYCRLASILLYKFL
jgi:hypothetical protein